MNRLSTDQIPRQQRLPFLHDFVGRQVARWQFKPLSDELSLDVAAFALADDVTVGKVKYSPIAGARTRELIADGRKNYILTIHDADHEIDVEDGPPILIKAGDMLLVNEGTRSRFRLPSVRANLVSLGHARLMDRLPGLGSQSHYHVPAATPGVDMVRDYADLLYRNSCAASGASAITSGHFYDLVAHSLAGQVKSDGDRTRQGVGAARLALAKREALKQLHDPALGITAVARSQGVTPRYLQRLFEGEGRSFTEFIREARLDLAFSRLCDAAELAVGISAIAFDCGFSDLSHFNRSFRRRFGQTPSDVRATALLKRRD